MEHGKMHVSKWLWEYFKWTKWRDCVSSSCRNWMLSSHHIIKSNFPISKLILINSTNSVLFSRSICSWPVFSFLGVSYFFARLASISFTSFHKLEHVLNEISTLPMHRLNHRDCIFGWKIQILMRCIINSTVTLCLQNFVKLNAESLQ